MTKKKTILVSKYNDLSKIYKIKLNEIYNIKKENKVYRIIPSPNQYYNYKRDRMSDIINESKYGNVSNHNYSK